MSNEHDEGEFRDEIKCPSCGRVDWEHSDYPSSLKHDGDKADTECSYCGKPMRVTLCVDYTYATAELIECPACAPAATKEEAP